MPAPRIYELPAGSTPESESLEIWHTPATVPGGARPGWGLPIQRERERDLTTSKQILENLRNKEFNDVTRWFDAQAAVLDQQRLDPERHKAAYARLQSQAMNQRTEIQAKHIANAQHIKIMQDMADAGAISPDQMQQTVLVMAGFPVRDVQRWAVGRKQQKPITRLRDLTYQAERIQAFRNRFVDDRRENRAGEKIGNQLYLVNRDTGKKTDTKASFDAITAYDDAELQLDTIQEEMIETFNLLSPLEKSAQAGAQAIERFGMGRRGRLGRMAARGAFGLAGLAIAKLTEPEKLTEFERKPRPTKEQPQKIMRQRNPKTGQIRESRDGGKTWKIISG